MWVKRVTLDNVRSFENETINLSKSINIIFGENNSGKSTILQAIHAIQEPRVLNNSDSRINKNKKIGNIKIELAGNDIRNYFQFEGIISIDLDFPSNSMDLLLIRGGTYNTTTLSSREPHNFIYPYLSKRKVVNFEEIVNEVNTTKVVGNLQYLYSKIDRISNPTMQPMHDEYINACKNSLGFVITAVASKSGKKGAYIVKNQDHISLDKMGEGVANMIGLIVDLCVAENNLFLIEEPENDIHPRALKSILDLILKKSENNQFVITTHSHIVTTFLGSKENSKVFHVTTKLENNLFTSQCIEVENSVEERRNILEQLGYVPYDMEMWDAWLFLEEASAERIIRDYFIPWFTANLKRRLRTYSAHSKDELEKRFAEFNVLFSFLNLEPVYKNRAWIILDGGESENSIVEDLRKQYTKGHWNPNHFLQFSEHNFEKYYPKIFSRQVKRVLSIENKKEKWEKKKALFENLVVWIEEDQKRARESFEKSAKEVISILKQIESEVCS